MAVTYDETAGAAANRFTEVHDTLRTVGIFPTRGAFYKHTLVLEGNDLAQTAGWVPLKENLDYHFSPLFLPLTSMTSREVHTYLVSNNRFRYIRVTYQAVGGYVDTILVNAIQEEMVKPTFDKSSPQHWLDFRGNERYQREFRRPLLKNDQLCAALTDGVSAIAETVKGLTPENSTSATLVQVTEVELRQQTVEQKQSVVRSEFNAIDQSFKDSSEEYASLKKTIEDGYYTQYENVDGYSYYSRLPATEHIVTHALNSFDLDVQFWAEDDDGTFAVPITNATMTDANTVMVTSDVPIRLRACIRRVISNGFVYESLTAKTNHPILHELNSGFLSSCVWVKRNGLWTQDMTRVTTLDNNNALVETDFPSTVKVVLQKPLANAYIVKLESTSALENINHLLNTGFVTVTVWVHDGAGIYRNDLTKISMSSLNTVAVSSSGNSGMKVVVQPVVEDSPSAAGLARVEHAVVLDKQDRLTLDLSALAASMEALRVVVLDGKSGTFDYSSTQPSTVHTINHKLGDNFVSAVIWVQDTDLVWRRDAVRVDRVNADTISITLSVSCMVEARVSRS